MGIGRQWKGMGRQDQTANYYSGFHLLPAFRGIVLQEIKHCFCDEEPILVTP